MKLDASRKNILVDRLKAIYGNSIADKQIERITHLIESYYNDLRPVNQKWTSRDIALITYGDSVQEVDQAPLQTLNDFLRERIGSTINIVHILPFFPYSSDDGFSVIDYKKVDPSLGTWDDIELLHEHYDLMFDLVINHISQESEWFKQFKRDKAPGKDYFITVNPEEDLSDVVRPRTNPLLKEVNTPSGKKYVWTTFSADQVDLNFANPDLLHDMLEIFITYLHKGARIIRLDAIAYLWKELGTSCIHLPQTHEIVKLLRNIAEWINPGAIILTETNVPNKENLSYFGSFDEAHMVYQFSLPPLLLHALFSGNAAYLNEWARTIPNLPEGATFYNFTASHDGIGVRPLEGLLPEDEKNRIVSWVKDAGGFVSYKANADGSESPYELNITYFDALKRDKSGKENLHIERFICSQTIMMSLRGVPAFYIHSLTATPNYHKGVEETGSYRSVNRRKWHKHELDFLIAEKDTAPAIVMQELRRIIDIRRLQPAFHPDAGQKLLALGDKVFAIHRIAVSQEIFSISNITSKEAEIDLGEIKALQPQSCKNIFTGDVYQSNHLLILAPYETVWLEKSGMNFS